MGDACRIDVVDSFDALDTLEPEWNALLAQSGADTIFLTWEWLHTWSACFLDRDRQPFVLVVREGARAVGIAPWTLRRGRVGPFALRRIEPMGGPETGSDHVDVFACRGREEAVARAVYAFLYGEGRRRWDELALRDVPASSPVLAGLLDALDRDGKLVAVEPGAYCPVVALPADVDTFESRLSPKARKRLRWEWRTLEKAGAVECAAADPGARPEALKELFDLHRSRFGERAAFEDFVSRAVGRMAGTGRARVDVLRVGGRAVAALLHLRHGARQSLYMVGVDRGFDARISLGSLLVHRAIADAIASGCAVYDFLRGIEPYKLRFATAGERALVVRAYRRRPATVLAACGDAARRVAKLLLR